jgi:ribosome-associated protein YbcJ (S4-like RNA binding protein)
MNLASMIESGSEIKGLIHNNKIFTVVNVRTTSVIVSEWI